MVIKTGQRVASQFINEEGTGESEQNQFVALNELLETNSEHRWLIISQKEKQTQSIS